MLDRQKASLRLEGAIQDLRELIDEVERKAPCAHTDDVWLVAAKLEQTYSDLNRVMTLLDSITVARLGIPTWPDADEETKVAPMRRIDP